MNNFIRLFLGGLFFAPLFWACGGGGNGSAPAPIRLDNKDAVTQQILSLRGKKNIDALLTYLQVENPKHRYTAALVLSAMQDSSANILAALSKALRDPQPEVRELAAYALGQTRSLEAANILTQAFREDSAKQVQAQILEAIGYCGNEEQLKYLASAQPYPLADTQLLKGQALAIYRYALRGIIHPDGTAKMVKDFIANPLVAGSARLVAANYLARAAKINLSEYGEVLTNAARTEKDTNTLIFLVVGLAKIQTPAAWNALKDIYNTANDYRVKVSILRGARYFNHDSTRMFMYNALADSIHPHIPLVAAEHFYATGRDLDAMQYFNWASAQKNWQVRVILQAAALKNLAAYRTPNKNIVSQRLLADFSKSTNLYEKAAIMQALGNYEWNYKFIARFLTPLQDSLVQPALIQSACAEALATIRNSSQFDRVMGMNKLAVVNEFNGIVRQAIEKGDAGVLAIFAELLLKPEHGFKQAYPDWQFISDAQKRLNLPRDIETWLLLQRVIQFMEGKDATKATYTGKTNLVEVDWQLIGALSERPKAQIQTNKGLITWELYPEDAPATVTQFVHLVKSNFYTNKTFHRVVPNFVVQGGCPRGDGWGGFELTIPTEPNPRKHYDASGYVGMASAGRDTESTQFFMTHTPTIHLDDNYTIFAKVIGGMDVLHRLTVGDTIQTIRLE